MDTEKRKILFISHSEKDQDIVSKFVELLFDIGLKKEDMICSSRTDIGIPVKENIYDFLRTILDSDNVITVFMLSDNYYMSPACLNEMGAVWVKQNDYYTFLLSGFDFKDIKGAIDPSVKGIRLSSNMNQLRGELTNFKMQIENSFSIKNSDRLDPNRWEMKRNQFIDSIKDYSDELSINLAYYRCYCKGEENFGGCNANYDKATSIISGTYDFTKTNSQACSIVFFVGEINALEKHEKNRFLQFYLKASSEYNITIELRLKNQDVQYSICTTNDWTKYSIPLQDFNGAKDNWRKLTEIKFLTYRKDIIKGKIEIKDMKLT